MAAGFVLCKFVCGKEMFLLFQAILPAIFISVIVLGIIILVLFRRHEGRKLLKQHGFYTVTYAPLSTDTNILLKISLLYPVVIFFVTGLLSSSIFFLSSEKDILNLIWDGESQAENLEINILGRVASHVKNINGVSYFSIALEKLQLKNKSSSIVKAITARDEVFSIIRTNDKNFLKRDDYISFKCRLFKNKDFMGIIAYQDNVAKINNYSASGTEDFFNTLCPSKINRQIYNIRSKFYECISKTFYTSLEYRDAALCEAIILGNTNNLPEKAAADFRKSGIYHLVAISGLHINFFTCMVTFFLNFILRVIDKSGSRLRILKLASFIVTVMVLLIYNFIAGQKASALRATCMSVFVLSANLLERQYSKKIILSLTFIILLVLYPEFFYDWGFWLSFTSVAGILYLNPILGDLYSFIKKRIQKSFGYLFGSFTVEVQTTGSNIESNARDKNYFAASIITTLSVNIILFPVLIYLFRELPVFSIPANLLAAPVFYVLLAVLLGASLLAILWPPAGGFVLKPAGFIIDILLKIARIYKISDFNVITLSNLKPYHMFIYYLAMTAVFIVLSAWLRKINVRR